MHPRTPTYTCIYPRTSVYSWPEFNKSLEIREKKAEEIERERDRNNQSNVIRSNTKKAEQRRKKKEGTRVR